MSSRMKILCVLLTSWAVLAAACVRGGGAVPDTTTTTESTTTSGGLTSGPGVEGDVIRLGALFTLSGPASSLGASVAAGHRVYWAYVNEDLGGVGGRFRVELVERDNAYDPDQNRAAFEGMVGEILAVSSTLGTPMTGSVLARTRELDMLLAAGSQGSFWAQVPNVVLDLAQNTFLAQFANGPYWAMEVADPPLITADTRVGIIRQDDDYGEDCLKGYQLAREHLDFNHVLEQAYPAGTDDLGPQMIAFQEAGVEVLFVCGLPSALGRMVTANLIIDYDPVMFGSSATYLAILPALLGGDGGEEAGLAAFRNYHHLGTEPAFEEDVPGMKLLRDNLERHGADVEPGRINSYFYFGYTQAATVHAVLEEALARGDLTRAGVVEAIDHVGEVDLGFGFGPAGFGPTVTERVPTNQGAVGRPARLSLARFGLQRVSGWFEAPYLADFDYGAP